MELGQLFVDVLMLCFVFLKSLDLIEEPLADLVGVNCTQLLLLLLKVALVVVLESHPDLKLSKLAVSVVCFEDERQFVAAGSVAQEVTARNQAIILFTQHLGV